MDELNVLGEPLQSCSDDPLTGFFRNGYCVTGPDDVGRHVVCCEMTAQFLAFSNRAATTSARRGPKWRSPA